VEYGREILSGHHGHEYLELDVSQADDLDAAVSRAFGEDPLLGIGFVGLSYFFSDEEVRDWPGRCIRCRLRTASWR
jgi:hypothetical protein